MLDPGSQPIGLDDPRLPVPQGTQPHVRAFLVWSRMPVVVHVDGRAYLSDQRFYGPLQVAPIPGAIRHGSGSAFPRPARQTGAEFITRAP